QAKFQGVAKEMSSEQTELAEARRAEELVAQSIAQSAKHGPIDPHPLSTVAKALSRDLSHKSIPLVKPRVRRNPGSDGHNATSLGGGNSLGELGSGLGSFAASLDPLDHVTFAPKAMIDRPRGASWTVRMPDDLIVPLVGTVTNVKRVPTGTVLRRLGSPEQAMKHSGSARTFARKVPLEDPRPSSRNTRELSTRELVGKAVLTYRDAISERVSPPRSRG
ncbi:hypothetical protein EBZ37_11875, partial [bacterium]|nr:hypothetical protein [bacterium]